jgi:hypothetical protein
VTVSGMTKPGNVTLTVAQGVAHDGNGTPNGVASASITFTGGSSNGTPPPHLHDAAEAYAHSPEQYTHFVIGAYARYLKRQPDAFGLAAWVNGMLAGIYSDELVEASFIGSPEYIANHGGTGQAWVTGMYQDLLGRNPADAEVQEWVNALANGASTTAVALGFAASPEREGQRVSTNYQTYLGRAPSAGEVSLWVNLFVNGGVSNEAMIGGFVGSPEYFNNSQKGKGDAATWIAQAYQDVLFRAPSSAEINLWLQVLFS